MKLFKQKDFTLLIMGKLVSLLGSNIQQFALSLYVLALTGSATIFASILSITIIPRLLLSPIAGVFGDWFDKKKSIVLLDLTNAFIIGMFAVIFFFNNNLSLLLIYILVILLEITEIFFGSAMTAVLPSIVKKEELLEANSINSMVMHIGNLLAPIFGALLYGIFGLFIVLIVNSLSFFISAISEIFINIPKTNKKPEKINLVSFKTDLFEGFKIIRNNKTIATIISIGTIINFIMFPYISIGCIYIIKEKLQASDFQFGMFEMTLSASMIVAPLFCTNIIKKVKLGKLLYLNFLLISLLVMLSAIIPSDFLLDIFIPDILPYISLLIISFFIGLLATMVNIAIGTLFNQIVPIELMSRTGTVLNLLITIFIPIGQMIFGYLYDNVHTSYVIIINSLLLLISLIIYRSKLFKIDDIVSNNQEGELAHAS